MSDLNEQQNLAACPFCGGRADTDFIEGASYIIECSICGSHTGFEDSPADAIAAWNRRAPAAAPAPVAAITALKLAETALLNSNPHITHFAQLNSHAEALAAVRVALACTAKAEPGLDIACAVNKKLGEALAARNAEIADLRAALAAAPAAASIVQPVADVGQMEYRGNSVAYIYQKMMAYKTGLGDAWDALRGAGFPPDGNTSLADAITGAFAATPASSTADAKDAALEQAAKICDVKYQLRSLTGHPREASTARALAEEIRAAIASSAGEVKHG